MLLILIIINTNIKFLLDEEIADVLIFEETKLGSRNCDRDFIYIKYNMFRRDRITSDKLGFKEKNCKKKVV